MLQFLPNSYCLVATSAQNLVGGIDILMELMYGAGLLIVLMPRRTLPVDQKVDYIRIVKCLHEQLSALTSDTLPGALTRFDNLTGYIESKPIYPLYGMLAISDKSYYSIHIRAIL